MAYTDDYVKTNWVNKPLTNTPLNQTNLNHAEQGIKNNCGRVANLSTTKAEQSDLLTVFKSVSFDSATGTFTFTRFNDTVVTINTDLEKIAVNFDYDDDPNSPHYQNLIITLADGTVKYADLSALITQYEFTDTATIDITVSAGGAISASVIDGSITASKLQPNYLADVTAQASIATNGANTATSQALVSEGWAKGTQNGTPVASGSPYFENNAEWFKNQAQQIAGASLGGLSDVTITTPTNGQVLTYDADNNIWRNSDGGSVETKSGNPLAITTDSAQVARSTTITLNPIQAAGTPTPDNNIPIYGYDNVELTGCGKNIINFSEYLEERNVPYTVSGGTFTVSPSDSKLYTVQFVFSNEDIPVTISGALADGTSAGIRIQLVNKAGNVSGSFLTNSTSVTANACAIRFDWNSIGTFTVSNLQLERGSTATAYEPYQQTNNLSLPLPETVYGGTLDVETGVLTVTKEMVDMGDLTWTYTAAGERFSAILTNSNALYTSLNWVCSCYATSTKAYFDADRTYNVITLYGNTALVRDSRYTDAATFKTAVTGQKLVYELATPYTIQLNPQQIALLAGANTLTSNGTTITVVYKEGKLASLADVEVTNRQINDKIRPITINTEVGNPITFATDSVQTAIGTSVVLEPIQAAGTPTPSNPLPISGYNNIEVKVPWGRNLLNPSNLIKGTFSDTQFNVTNVGSTVYRSYKAYLSKGNYTISFDKTVDVIVTIKDGVYSSSAEVYTSKTYTLVNDGWFGLSWRDNTSSSTNWDDTAPIQLELGSTATTYSPFSLVTDINMYLPNTVYGGTYNVEYGVLTVTRGIADMGDLEWTENSDGYYTASISGKKNGSNALVCSCYKYESNKGWGVSNLCISDESGGTNVYVHDTNYTDAATFKTAVTGQKIVYELATPYNLQLTPQQVRLPNSKDQGGRVMWTNGTAISMTYRKGEMASLWNTFQLGAALDKVAVQTFSGMVSAQRISTGTFQGHVNADATSMANLGAAQVRNILITDTAPTVGSSTTIPDGTLIIVYE